MKRMTVSKRLCRNRQYRRIKVALMEYVTLMDKIVAHKADGATPSVVRAMHDEMAALRTENKKLKRRRQVIRIENVNINTLVNKQ